jgi:hypothetical protein
MVLLHLLVMFCPHLFLLLSQTLVEVLLKFGL